MPYFSSEAEISIDLDEYVLSCSSREIKELIEVLKEEGRLDPSRYSDGGDGIAGFSESEFEEALKKIKGKWNMLSQEEEQIILKIASRF